MNCLDVICRMPGVLVWLLSDHQIISDIFVPMKVLQLPGGMIVLVKVYVPPGFGMTLNKLMNMTPFVLSRGSIGPAYQSAQCV